MRSNILAGYFCSPKKVCLNNPNSSRDANNLCDKKKIRQ
jgi:hypothetical protein